MSKAIEKSIIKRCMESSASSAKLAELAPLIAAAGNKATAAIAAGRKVMFCGNGGSAADSQHLATELAGKFRRQRQAWPALALTVNASTLTAVGNDFGYREVFARQIAGLGNKGDILIAISTSGNSDNVLQAARLARRMGIFVIGFTGMTGGKLARLSDIAIKVPARRTELVQEMHIIVGHIICGMVEDSLAPPSGQRVRRR